MSRNKVIKLAVARFNVKRAEQQSLFRGHFTQFILEKEKERQDGIGKKERMPLKSLRQMALARRDARKQKDTTCPAEEAANQLNELLCDDTLRGRLFSDF